MRKPVFLLTLLFAFGNGNSFCQDDSAPANDVGIQFLGHVGIGVSDLDRAMHFYRDQLGFTEVFRLPAHGSPFLVYLRVNNNNFIELFPGSQKQTESGAKRTGLQHLGFWVKDLQTTLRSLQSRGYPVPDDAFKQAAQVRADGTFLYFIKDPDGNPIELSQMLPDSKQGKSQR